jgi:hypothetical protein
MPLLLGEDNMDGEATCWLKWPLTIEKAADEIIKHLTRESQNQIVSENDVLKTWYHFGLFVRNNLQMWDFYRDHETISEHPDWLSYDVLQAVQSKLRKQE